MFTIAECPIDLSHVLQPGLSILPLFVEEGTFWTLKSHVILLASLSADGFVVMWTG